MFCAIIAIAFLFIKNVFIVFFSKFNKTPPKFDIIFKSLLFIDSLICTIGLVCVIHIVISCLVFGDFKTALAIPVSFITISLIYWGTIAAFLIHKNRCKCQPSNYSQEKADTIKRITISSLAFAFNMSVLLVILSSMFSYCYCLTFQGTIIESYLILSVIYSVINLVFMITCSIKLWFSRTLALVNFCVNFALIAAMIAGSSTASTILTYVFLGISALIGTTLCLVITYIKTRKKTDANSLS